MNRLKLKIIEQRIEQGKGFQFLRKLDRQSGQSERFLAGDFENPEALVGPLISILRTARDEMTVSRLPVIVRDIEQESSKRIKVVVEEIRPKRRLVVFGAGHVGQTVGLMGALLGFNVVVIDDRPEFASRKRFPDSKIDLIAGDYSEVISGLKLETGTAVVIVTRGHQFDEICLRGTVKSNAGYLGMIGSKRRVLSIVDKLEKDGYSRADFDRLHAPIGLQIGAGSPQEIAVAILAEIISHFNGKNLK